MGKKNVIFFKQAEISQMEKDLNQRTQDAKERDKEVCSLEYATVVACERRPISGCRLSPPKNTVCELEPRNDFRDVKTFVLLLTNKIHR